MIIDIYFEFLNNLDAVNLAQYLKVVLRLIDFLCHCVAASKHCVHIVNRHLLNYTEPTYQRYMVRITSMVPVYVTMSFMSLVMGNNFLSLCLIWVDGPGAVVTSLSGQVLKSS